MKRLYLILSLVFAYSQVLFAQTDVSAGNVSGTWTKANSPYHINGDIIIQNATSLIIEPGVVVEFQGFYKLTVEGQLLAVGTQADTIEFTVNDTTGLSNTSLTNGAWHGIRFDNNTSADSSKLVYCKLHYGKATDGDGNTVAEDDKGGAIYVNGFSKLLVQNCLIKDNYADQNGGAIYEYESEMTINNNTISDNHADKGGALYCKGSGTLFENATISSNLIQKNRAVQGGGIYTDHAHTYIENNILANNFASFMGGAIFLYYTSHGDIYNNKIVNNESDTGAGIMVSGNYYSNILSNVICNNYSSGNHGAGIHVQSSSSTRLNVYNNTIANNQGDGIYAGDKVYIKNTIFWGNTDQIAGSGSNIYIDQDNCTYQNSPTYAIHGKNPDFVNPSSGVGIQDDALTADWSLKPTSEAVNIGKEDTTGLNLPEKDIAGNPRFYDKRVDIGAYELNKAIERKDTLDYDITWIADTVNIIGDLYIPNGMTLTIPDSTIVNFTGHYKINVQGRILAQGLNSNSIAFTYYDTTGFSNTSDNSGGWAGIRFDNTSTANDSSKFENCKFEYGKVNIGTEFADSVGGALYINKFSKISVTHSVFYNNYASMSGGAVAIAEANPVFNGNILSNNITSGYGAAVAFKDNANPTFVNNIICNNQADYGGALTFYNSGGSNILNNTIANNKAIVDGGGIYCEENSSPVLRNNIIYGNTATSGNQVYLYDNGSNPSFSFNDVEGTNSGFGLESGVTYSGNYTNNIDYLPQFSSATAGSGSNYNGLTADWALTTSSSCLNSGDENASGLPVYDYANNPRVYNGRVDLGAIELQQAKEICGHITQNDYWVGDTVKVNCETTVDAGVTLTIAPGTVVDFTGNYKLIVQGVILAQGTKADSIFFTTTDVATGWHGIRFEGNSSTDSSKFSYCKFEHGKATGSGYDAVGGGVYSDGFSNFLIKNSLFTNNSATSGGGAVYIKSASPKFVNNKFIDNSSIGSCSGGAVYFEYNCESEVINNLFSNNSSGLNGGAMVISNSDIKLINNTIVNNSASTGGGAIWFNTSDGSDISTIKNCIVYGNVATNGNQFSLDADANPNIYNCDIEGGSAGFYGGSYTGTYSGNIDSDPQFTNPSSGVGNQTDALSSDWSLKETSPCINAGSDTTGLNLPALDLADNERVVNSNVDIGAYESKVTYECGNISQNTVWDADTVKVGCDITVDNGVTLSIAEGTYIEFQGHYKIDVQGQLLAVGTQTDSIIFTINDTTNYSDINADEGSWYGINFDATATSNDTSKLEYCRINYTKKRGGTSSNDATNSGGCIFANNYSKIIIQNNLFKYNYAVRSGGAVYLKDSYVKINENIFYKNRANWGAAIYFSGTSSITISNNIISNNYGYVGGGIYFNGSSGNIVNNLICNNQVTDNAGGLFTSGAVNLTNNTIVNNKSTNNGGGLYTINTEPIVTNCILYGNTATEGNQVYLFDDSSDPDFTNCDIQGGTATFGIGSSGTYTGNYTDNINSDPIFVSPTASSGTDYSGLTADWSLQGSTPCLNTGKADTTGLNIPRTDLADNQRVYNNVIIDIGAYEFLNNPPEISAQDFNINENSSANTHVADVAASDTDGNSFTYAITDGNTNNAFKIALSTGELKVSNQSELNYETVPDHKFTLTIKVTDNGTGNLSDSANITINLNDINDNPVMERDTFEIVENLNNGTFVKKLLATDEDTPAQTLTYSIVSGSFSNYFSISSDSLFVFDSTGLDYETSPSGDIRLKVDDGNGGVIYQYVNVILRDTNDTPKVNNQNFNVDEQSTVGTSIGTVQATDEDSPAQTLTYAIVAGNNNQAFALNPSTGELTVNNSDSIDYELSHSQTISIKVTDDDSTNPLSSTADVTINLNNINDNAPVFADTSVNIDENSNEGTLIAELQASDVDSLGNLSFSFISGNENNIFYLQNGNGNKLYVSKYDSMDYELHPSFELLMSVTDGDSTTQAVVTVNLNDINEYPSLGTYNFNIDELSPDSTIVGTVVGTDPDNGQELYYYITDGNYNNAFVLDSVSGTIYVLDSTKLDHEGNYPNYSLTITVKDNGVPQLETYNYIHVAVNDINESPVIDAQTFHVNENSEINTIVGSIQTTDPDANTTLSYNIISGNENGIFNLDASGTLSVQIPDSINYEVTNQYSFVVEVTDNTSLTDTATITVMVDNVNEPPYFTSQDTFYIDENSPYQTVVGTVEATDPDGDNIVFYSQSSSSFPAFFINSDGTIIVQQTDSLDFETQNSKTVIAVAQSNGYLKAYDTLTIMLNDVNEAPIVIEGQEAHVDEHSPAGTIVDTVKTITDAGESLSYSIIDGNLHNAYSINSETGVISVQYADSLDVNQGAKLHVKVVDNSVEHYSGEGYVWVYVNNVNDPPVIIHQVFYFSDENPYHGEWVGAVSIVDSDNNNSYTYSIESGNIDNAFQISGNSKEASLEVNNESAINPDNIPTYNLIVKVDDGEYSDTAIVTVNLWPEGINQEKFSEVAELYPNPVKSKLFVKLRKGISEVSIKIFDINQKQVYSQLHYGSEPIDVSKYARGVYFVQVIYNNKVYLDKIIFE